jgi:hypothetical protein
MALRNTGAGGVSIRESGPIPDEMFELLSEVQWSDCLRQGFYAI